MGPDTAHENRLAPFQRVCRPPLRTALGVWEGVPVKFALDGLIAQSIEGFFVPRNARIFPRQYERFQEISSSLARVRYFRGLKASLHTR